jgi:hypothetical protein
MTNTRFSIAELRPEEIEEIRKMERKMSDRSGHAISLIAYEAQGGPNDDAK